MEKILKNLHVCFAKIDVILVFSHHPQEHNKYLETLYKTSKFQYSPEREQMFPVFAKSQSSATNSYPWGLNPLHNVSQTFRPARSEDRRPTTTFLWNAEFLLAFPTTHTHTHHPKLLFTTSFPALNSRILIMLLKRHTCCSLQGGKAGLSQAALLAYSQPTTPLTLVTDTSTSIMGTSSSSGSKTSGMP